MSSSSQIVVQKKCVLGKSYKCIQFIHYFKGGPTTKVYNIRWDDEDKYIAAGDYKLVYLRI